MAIIKCKMCGGDLNIKEGSSTARCEYCNNLQTVPYADGEKKLTLFNRANRLRAACEFDKAAGVYETIVVDFPNEAEAYWGLVLCKYGVEYVDDPASGSKVPTCHRSSFDVVTENSDFALALKHADVIARKVYLEEAGQLEEIRKGIVSVSSNEQPYDIFICYKETAANGGRTLDSVLAQDVYDALVSKGYRVFFSRITLEDKLGTEYEPYIFAALNSARIMLAFGTDPEYFNAVWVKNEWSRFLKLMANDNTKRLIPCYKGIDVSEMPPEFTKFQAQDLGKVGATQDLLRGISKILPLQENTCSVPQSSVTDASALVMRGQFALDDGEWDQANGYFERALDENPRDAQAYIGKMLVEFRLSSLEQVAKRSIDLEESNNFRRALLFATGADKAQLEKLQENRTRFWLIKQLTCGLRNIAKQKEPLERLDVVYNNACARMDAAKTRTEFEDLARAFDKIASHRDASNKAKQCRYEAQVIVYQELKTRCSYAKTQEEYEKLAAEFEKLNLHQAAAEQAKLCRYEAQDVVYARGMALLSTAKTETQYLAVAKVFESISAHRDAWNQALRCRQTASDLKAAAIAREKRKKLITALVVIALILAAVLTVLTITVFIPMHNYNAAVALMEEGNYQEAIAAFEAMDGYKDSNELISECHYRHAMELQQAASYSEAVEIFEALGDYKDSADQAKQCWYLHALVLQADGQYFESIRIFESLNGYKDSATQILENYYRHAYVLKAAGDDLATAIAFGKLGDYKDAQRESFAIWDGIAIRDTLDAGCYHTVGLKTDGTLVAIGSDYFGQISVTEWTDIIAISVGSYHTVGLRSDGTVLALGDNAAGQCDVSQWKHIVAISASDGQTGGEGHTVGLKSDGTVVATGSNDHGQCNVSGWTEVVAISAGAYHTVGLKADGTLLVAGTNNYGQCDVTEWTDIVDIRAGVDHTVGLKADGTVVAAGWNHSGQCNVTDWTDIVAIATYNRHTVGLKADGTLVAVGENSYNRCNVGRWSDIVLICVGFENTIGVRADGTLVAVGNNEYGQSAVSKWADILIYPNN